MFYYVDNKYLQFYHLCIPPTTSELWPVPYTVRVDIKMVEVKILENSVHLAIKFSINNFCAALQGCANWCQSKKIQLLYDLDKY